MYSITINAFVYVTVLAQNCTPNGVIIYTIIKVLFQNIKSNFYQPFIIVIQIISFHNESPYPKSKLIL